MDDRDYSGVNSEPRLPADPRADRQIVDGMSDAVLLLDDQLQVIHANAVAAALLDRGDGLALRQRRLVARHPDDDSRLQAALHPAPRLGLATPENFAVIRRRERRPLPVKAMPLAPRCERTAFGSGLDGQDKGPRAPAEARPRNSATAIRADPAEAAVVAEMLPSRSEDEAARRRGVAKATFRAQLHAAYGKLGVNGRDELVHLVASYGFR